jgi:hypothetical protein
MASVDDVFHQLQTANGTLTQIRDDTVAVGTDVNNVKTSVDAVDTTLDQGFSVLTADNQVIANELHQIDTTVLHLAAQNDTIICSLSKIAEEICTLINEAAKQTALQQRIADDARALRQMYATTNPAAALELARADAVEQRIDACCPPSQPTPPCRFEPCPAPAPLKEEPVPSQVPRFVAQNK